MHAVVNRCQKKTKANFPNSIKQVSDHP